VNHHFRRRGGLSLAWFLGGIWYGLWIVVAYSIGTIAADPEKLQALRESVPKGLLLLTLYWQLVPVVMVSSGVSLDLNRILVYPIPRNQLFGIEILLRITTCAEMVLVTAGLAAGLWLNPSIPGAAPAALVPFVIFNLLISAGLRDLLGRLVSRKGFREIAVLVIVLLAASPQLLLLSEQPAALRRAGEVAAGWLMPWGAAAAATVGDRWVAGVIVLLFWTAAAYGFSRDQFERALRFDAAEARSRPGSLRRGSGLAWLWRVTEVILSDPLAALLEKEIKSLSRSSRFRLVFLMGFSFGLLIWFPLTLNDDFPLRSDYLTIVSLYAVLLLGDVCFWNNLGLDRGAARIYFAVPLKLGTVLAAKNLAAILFVWLEVAAVAFVSAILQFPVTVANVLEALAVTFVFALFLMVAGNLLSTRYPRPLNPSQSWSTGSTVRVQMYLFLLYPVAAIPLALAYGARYAFDSNIAFYGVLGIDLFFGALLYPIALESAVSYAESRKEQMLATLSQAEGPISF
jgi:ABC-2 type transport system permease protein